LSENYRTILNNKASKPDGVTSFTLNEGVQLIGKNYPDLNGLKKDQFISNIDIIYHHHGFLYMGAR
jgi:hypothetical protein